MRYFIDSAVINALRLRDDYQRMHYVGLSGGAVSGLHVCAVLQDMIDQCVLVAGVMPEALRLEKKSFGDAEQITSSFARQATVMTMIEAINASTTKLTLIYNADDPCCFDRPLAEKFRDALAHAQIKDVDFTIREASDHGFDADAVLNILATASSDNRP